jgi:hypothetical protein
MSIKIPQGNLAYVPNLTQYICVLTRLRPHELLALVIGLGTAITVEARQDASRSKGKNINPQDHIFSLSNILSNTLRV